MAKLSNELKEACHKALDALLAKLELTQSSQGEIDVQVVNSYLIKDLIQDPDHCGELMFQDKYVAYAVEEDSLKGFDTITFERQVVGQNHDPEMSVAKTKFEY